MKASIFWIRSLTLIKMPRFILLACSILNHVSTWFIQDALVGVKWMLKRLCLLNHAFTFSCYALSKLEVSVYSE